jgi:signal transduction histidine kinase/CheY-like chemotaxis protein
MLSELVKAFELSNTELLVLSVPNMSIVDISSSLQRKWGVEGDDIIGKPLMKFGTGLISARHSKSGDETALDVSYAPPLGVQIVSQFQSMDWNDGQSTFKLLIGSHPAPKIQALSTAHVDTRLSTVMRSAGYAVWEHDFVTHETLNSAEMGELLSYAPDDNYISFAALSHLLHPDDKSNALDKLIASAPASQDMFQTRVRYKTKPGAYAWIETVASLTRDAGKQTPLKLIGLCRNIDDQMTALDRLKNSERTLKRTQAATKIGSFSLRVETGTSRVTAELATLLGMADARVHPNLKNFIGLMEGSDKEKFSEALELAKLGQQIKNLEIAAKLASGDVVWFEITMEPERNSSGTVETIFGICQSTTERKALERKFYQAQKMEAVGQLTGGIAHDFNNLLMVVMGNLQLIEQLVKGDERALKRIRSALEAADRGSELTRRMLAFSRQQTLQPKAVSLNDQLFSMQDMLRQAATAIVDVKFMPGDELWPVKVDVTMLETALLNLTINARDAMAPKGGNLMVETANRYLDADYCRASEDVLPGDYVQISITDTGSGIAPEHLEKVFQPFFTTKAPEAGSGLGLSMIYGFVKQSGGHIKIYSELGVGTTIKIYLPRNKVKGETDTANPTPVAQIPEDRKCNILVVEDNDSVRDVAAAMIEEMGFNVLTAINGHDGLKAIEANVDIDLVLSDVIMAGGMNGPELAAKAIKLRPELKILFMSGYAPGSVRQMQDLPDTIDLVNKPFTRNDLTEKVRKALAA